MYAFTADINYVWTAGLAAILILITIAGVAALPWRGDQLAASAGAFKTLGRVLWRCTPWGR